MSMFGGAGGYFWLDLAGSFDSIDSLKRPKTRRGGNKKGQ